MSVLKNYSRATAPTMVERITFSKKAKFLSSIPPTMDRGVSEPTITNTTTINNSYVVADNITPVAIVTMPVIMVPYLLYIDTDGSLRLTPAVYKDAVITDYEVSNEGLVIGSSPSDHRLISKDLYDSIEDDDSVGYSLTATDISAVTSTVVTVNDPDMIHSQTVIRGISSPDRASYDAVAHWDVLAVTVTLTAGINVPVWYFENNGLYGKHVRFGGVANTSNLIFTVSI